MRGCGRPSEAQTRALRFSEHLEGDRSEGAPHASVHSEKQARAGLVEPRIVVEPFISTTPSGLS